MIFSAGIYRNLAWRGYRPSIHIVSRAALEGLLTLLPRFVDPPVMSTIMIVDDDVSTRFVLRLILERAGHEVVEAAHGEAALRMISPSSLPDVVTTDLSMPIVSGEELIERLRPEPRTAAIPIVVVSSTERLADDRFD